MKSKTVERTVLTLLLSIMVCLACFVYANSVSATVRADGIDTEAELNQALLTENSIVLSGDVMLTSELKINKEVTIDLAYNTLTLAKGGNSVTKDATIKNGTLCVDGVYASGDCILGVGNRSVTDVTLTLQDVDLVGSDYSSAFAVIMVYNGNNLTVNGGEWTLSNEKSSAGGVIKNSDGAGNKSNVAITDTVMNFENVSRGISGTTTVLNNVELNVEGGDNGINGCALIVNDSTINIKNGTGRAITVTSYDVVINNSNLNLSGNQEADIRFKTANKITADDKTVIAECTVFADVKGATINDQAIGGSEDVKASLKIENGAVSVQNPVLGLEGEGSATSPYLINNIEEFKYFRDKVNAGDNYSGKYVKLTTDIDLGNEEWTPIGYMGKTFKGNFDGGNCTIKNLKITKTLTNTSANNGIGLFGRTDSPATIANLTIENVDVTGSLNVGALVGSGYTGKSIENVTVKGDIAIDAWWYAGVIGGNGYMNLINDCHVVGNDGSYVLGNDGSYIGGIWGFRGEGNNKITNCTVTNLNITGVDRVAGIAGIGHYGNTVSNCTANNVNVTATDSSATTVGLVVGACQGKESSPTVIKDNVLTDVQVKIGDTILERPPLYGSDIDGNAPKTNLVACVDGAFYFESLQDAVDVAKVDQEIALLCDTDETVLIPAGVKFDANGFDATNVTVEELKIKDVLVKRDETIKATIIIITYINCEKNTEIIVYDGKDGQDGKDGSTGSTGLQGKPGVNGQDGLTPTIGENGNWWIGEVDTGVLAKGENGLDGKDGVDGADGINGLDGKDGVNGIDGKDSSSTTSTIALIIGGLALLSNIIMLAILIMKKR